MIIKKDNKTGGLVVAGSNPVTPTIANIALSRSERIKNTVSLCKCRILAIAICNYTTTTLSFIANKAFVGLAHNYYSLFTPSRIRLLLITTTATTTIFLSACTMQKLDLVNKQVNSYQYIANTNKHPKTPEQFYADGGGNCKDFANAKKAILGGVMVRTISPNHAYLKVDGWLLDSRTNKIIPASMIKTYPYEG